MRKPTKCRISQVTYYSHTHLPGSLKDFARSKRGKGIRRRVRADIRIPGDWTAFLRVDENKEELFLCLVEQLTIIETDHGEVVSTKHETVIFDNDRTDAADLSPCGHEEANTRLLLHAADAARCGYTKAMVRTVDTDVVVIAVANYQYISLSELWIEFGVGKNLKYLPAHDISRSIGEEKSQALLAFHAFTGCDQTSSFAHYGKKTAWAAWSAFDDVTAAFQALSNAPTGDVVDEVMPILERYVTIMYDRNSIWMKVNDARRDLFTRIGRDIEAIPPTSDALRQHVKRPRYQAGHCWGNSLVPSPPFPCPSEWGLVKVATDTWAPLWMTFPQASQSCQELLKCDC